MVARVATAFTQLILGFYLLPDVFGIYGFAHSILSLTAIMRAGGTATYMPSMRPEEFHRESGRLFGWGLLCAVTGCAITSGLAVPLANWQMRPELAWALWALAGRNFISVFSIQMRMRMVVDLRFRELAALDTFNSIGKLVLSWVLAIALADTEYAVLVLAVPYAAASLIELVYCLFASGITLDEMTPRPKRLLQTAVQLRWSLALAVAISLNSQTNLLVMKSIIPLAAVGWIYWAYQLASQPATMLSTGLSNILAPTMARERGDPATERRTMRNIFAGAMLLVPFICFGLNAVFPAAEALVYHGRWAPATWPLLFLSIGLCYVTISYVLYGPLVGLRQFKRLAGVEAIRGGAMLAGTTAGCFICSAVGLRMEIQNAPDQAINPEIVRAAVIISATTGIAMAATSIGQLYWIMRRFGMGALEFSRTVFFGPAIALLVLTASRSIADSLAESFAPADCPSAVVNGVRLLVTTVIFGGAAIIVVRFLAEETVRRAVEVLPARFRAPVRRALILHRVEG